MQLHQDSVSLITQNDIAHSESYSCNESICIADVAQFLLVVQAKLASQSFTTGAKGSPGL